MIRHFRQVSDETSHFDVIKLIPGGFDIPNPACCDPEAGVPVRWCSGRVCVFGASVDVTDARKRDGMTVGDGNEDGSRTCLPATSGVL